MLNIAHSSTALRCPELSVRAKTDPSCSNFITLRVGTPCRSSAWASQPGGLSQHTGLLKASALFSPNMFCILQSCRKGQIVRSCLNPHLHSGSNSRMAESSLKMHQVSSAGPACPSTSHRCRCRGALFLAKPLQPFKLRLQGDLTLTCFPPSHLLKTHRAMSPESYPQMNSPQDFRLSRLLVCQEHPPHPCLGACLPLPGPV